MVMEPVGQGGHSHCAVMLNLHFQTSIILKVTLWEMPGCRNRYFKILGLWRDFEEKTHMQVLPREKQWLTLILTHIAWAPAA